MRWRLCSRMKTKTASKLRDGAACRVIGGTHKGRSGIVTDIKTGKTGYVSITVVQSDGVRFKTLARNVDIT
jgi:ribosomal protein S4E